MKILMAVAFGGALGAIGRYTVGHAALRVLGSGFPWGTLTVNVLGGFLIGFLVEALALKFTAGPTLRAFLVTGVLGGFTTFSAFSLEAASMIQRGALSLALLYAVAAAVLAIGAVFGGLWFGRAVWG